MIRTRFAPSPTGFLHIGSLRTALYSYALAKHSGGEFLLRIEDTDQKRTVPGAVEKLQDLLSIFRLNWDGDPIFQSSRAQTGVYRDAALALVKSGHAFYSQSTARNAKTDGFSTQLRDPDRDRNLTSGAIKLRIPDHQTVTFHDFVLNKDISWNTDQVPDMVLLKSDGLFPTYHLAQAVDDHEFGISHVVRTAEWLTSTPLHILIHQYLGFDLPQIGHPTAILDPSGGKLSKRKGNVSVDQFLSDGYLPEALLNFILLLGWAPKDNREMFTLDEFVSAFDIAGLQKSNPVLNLDKLDWFNGKYIRSKSDTDLTPLVKPYVKDKLTDDQITQILPLVKDRLVKLSDFASLTQFFVTPPDLSPQLFPDRVTSASHLELAMSTLSSVEFSSSAIDSALVTSVKERGWKVGDFFMTLRLAVCGSRFTPPLTSVMLILGQSEVIARLNSARKLLN